MRHGFKFYLVRKKSLMHATTILNVNFKLAIQLLSYTIESIYSPRCWEQGEEK